VVFHSGHHAEFPRRISSRYDRGKNTSTHNEAAEMISAREIVSTVGLGSGVGIAFGAVSGTATGNLSLGLALGLALGSAAGLLVGTFGPQARPGAGRGVIEERYGAGRR
jgi:hypothetical protein